MYEKYECCEFVKNVTNSNKVNKSKTFPSLKMAESKPEHVSKPHKNNFISNPVLKILLEGLYDEGCNLSKLRGCPHIVKTIWMDVQNFWKRKIIVPSIYEKIPDGIFFAPICWSLHDEEAEKYSFPEPSDININMMPFIGTVSPCLYKTILTIEFIIQIYQYFLWLDIFTDQIYRYFLWLENILLQRKYEQKFYP